MSAFLNIFFHVQKCSNYETTVAKLQWDLQGGRPIQSKQPANF